MRPERPRGPQGNRPPPRRGGGRRRPGAGGEAGCRRRYPRAPFAAFVDLCSGERRQRVRAVDVSPGGIGVVLATAGEPPAAACAELPLPGLRLPLVLDAELAWVDPDRRRAGFRFREGNDALRELLARFVEGEFER